MYLHEEHYYVISNYAVARNPIFCDIGIQTHFREKMKFYLEPICEILSYNLKDSEFQILLRLKNRNCFEDLFNSKNKIEGHIKIPESTYIFSQAMSNLQNSLVKKFNLRHNRSGTLMAGRFQRELITSQDSVLDIIQEMNKGKGTKRHSGIWADCAYKRIKAMTSSGDYSLRENNFEGDRDSFWDDFKKDLVGTFDYPSVNSKYFKFFFLDRRTFNSICKHFS